ncbi:MAG: thioredoxin family protein [Candidatus Nanopelagicales bacterium]
MELLYFDDCPNWIVAESRLTKALSITGHDHVTVERRRIESVEQARAVGFLGSPTIRIDGVDPFAFGTEQVGLSCRLFDTPAGLRGSPTIEQLVHALS